MCMDARGDPALRVSGGLERLSDGSGSRGHLCDFFSSAPAGSRFAAHARLGRRLRHPLRPAGRRRVRSSQHGSHCVCPNVLAGFPDSQRFFFTISKAVGRRTEGMASLILAGGTLSEWGPGGLGCWGLNFLLLEGLNR